jgi:arylsulfatase A-like enzyme
MHVPLVIIGPDVPAGKRITTQISLQNLFPTMLKLLKMNESPPAHRDLTLYWGDTGLPTEQKPVFGQFYRSQHLIDYHGEWYDCDAFMIRSPEWKITTRTNGIRRKYHLLSDSLESTDLSETAELTYLDTLLDLYAVESIEAIETFTPVEISEEEKAKLRAVGYIQ